MYFKKLSGLQNYYFNSIIKSKICWIAIGLTLVAPLLSLMVMYFIGYNLLASSYIYGVLLLVSCFLTILVFAITLFANQITDSTDLILISKSIQRGELFANKTLITGASLLLIFFVQSILAIIFTSIVRINNMEILAYWLITFFGQIFVALFFTPIVFFLSYKFTKSVALSANMSLILTVILFSFLSHFVLPNAKLNNELISNDNYKMSYSQLIILDDKGNQVEKKLVVKQNISDSNINSNTNYKTNIDNVPGINNLMIGEWLFSPFQTMYMSVNYTDNFPLIAAGVAEDYKLGLVRFTNTKIESVTDFVHSGYNYLPIRVEDKSIFDLNAADLDDLLVSEISNILLTSQDGIDFNNLDQLQNLLQKINNENLVWDQTFSGPEIRTISALLGLDGKHPSIYYAFKYKDFISAKLNGLFETIANDISPTVADIYQAIFSNSEAYSAILFNSVSGNFADSHYPSVEVINLAMPPAKSDLDYFKKILVNWKNNQPSLLMNDNSRNTINLANIKFQDKDYAITSADEWTSFIDENATSLQNLKDIYQLLKNRLGSSDQDKIAVVNYAANYIDINQYSYAAVIGQQSWLDYSYIYMMAMFIGSLMLFVFSYKSYSKITY